MRTLDNAHPSYDHQNIKQISNIAYLYAELIQVIPLNTLTPRSEADTNGHFT